MNTLFAQAKQLPFVDAKHMVLEIAENMDIEIPKIKSWLHIESIIIELLSPAIDEAKKQEREIRRAKRLAAREVFADNLIRGQKFKLENGLLIEFVSVNERMLCEAIVIDEDSLTWCVGDSYPVGISELMKAEKLIITRAEYMSNANKYTKAYYAQFVTDSTVQFIKENIGLNKLKKSKCEHLNDVVKITGAGWVWDASPFNLSLARLAGEVSQNGYGSKSTATMIGKNAAKRMLAGEL